MQQPASPLKPHRGTAILVLGILGLVVCQVLGVFAWIMGNNDLKAMDQGIMDPSGRSNTEAGRICGIIATILLIIGVALALVFLLIWLFFVGAIAMIAASA